MTDKLIMPNFIIAGTPKAATTSIFRYLADHPEVCGSYVKEPNFFVKHYTGEPGADKITYSKFFESCDPSVKVVMEGTIGYLDHGAEVAKRIKDMVPDVKLLLSLRNPVDSVYSYYNFHMHVAKGYDESVTFEDYIGFCEKASAGEPLPESLKIKSKRLRVLDTNRYIVNIKEYLKYFEREQIKIMFYEDIKADIHAFLRELCEFLDVDPGFFDDYTFKKHNVTPTVKSKGLHKFMHKVENKISKVAPKRQDLKDKVRGLISKVNLEKEGYPPMSDEARERLEKYFAPYNKELKELMGDEPCPPWVG